ncbi:LptF/LptG family permease [bacterium]|nr:LptF/LptG family permease [bacterium]
MKVIRRYILLELAGPFVFSLTLLTFILFMRQMVLLFPKFAGKDLPWRVIAELLGLSLPFIVALVLPMSALLGVIMAFGRLSADNEITAFKALGVPAHRLMWAPLGASVLLALGAVWFNDRVLPETNHRYKNLLIDIAYLKPTLQLEEGVVMDDFPGMNLMVNRIRSGRGKSLHPVDPGGADPQTVEIGLNGGEAPADLFGIVITETGQSSRTIVADSGSLSFLPNRKDALLTLYDGEIQELDPNRSGQLQRVFFERHRIRLADVGGALERGRGKTYRSDRELNLSMIEEQVKARYSEVDSLVHAAAALVDSLPAGDSTAMALRSLCGPDLAAGLRARKTYPTALVRFPAPGRQIVRDDPALRLSSLLREASFTRRRIASLEVEWWKKFALPFASLVFVLLGVPLGILTRRGGAGVSLAISFGIFLVYWVCLISGETLAERLLMSPFWAMWAPNAIFLVLGLALLVVQVRGTRSLGLAAGGLSLWRTRRVARPAEPGGQA